MVEPVESNAKRLEIKKYPNRRYYDATHSKHLTLEEIRSLVQQGYDIQVIDAKTSADITGQVLTQIILELDTPKLDSLPVPLLVRLIRMNDDLVKDFIEKYFNRALQSFLDYQCQMEDQMRKAHGLTAGFPSVSDWTKAMFKPFAAAFTGGANEETKPPASTSADSAANQNLPDLIRQLQQELARLKQVRGGKSARKSAPKRRGKRG